MVRYDKHGRGMWHCYNRCVRPCGIADSEVSSICLEIISKVASQGALHTSAPNR